MDVFTSGRDYRPHTSFGNHLPSNAVYARVLVAAPSYDAARELLEQLHMQRFDESLRGPSGGDGPAEAVEAYLRDQGITTVRMMFVVYRIDTDVLGTKLTPPRLLVAVATTDGGLTDLGRIRTVSMGLPTQPHPVCRIVPDDNEPDPVPLAGRPEEGPAPDVDLVEGPIEYPTGALGYLTKERERQLLGGLPDALGDLTKMIATIERYRRSPDPRVSWSRESGQLLDLSRRFAELAADAAFVETVLQAGI